MDALSKDTARWLPIFRVCLFIAVLAALSPMATFGLEQLQQQQKPVAPTADTSAAQPVQFSDEKVPDSARWRTVFWETVAVTGLILFCLIAGTGAAAIILLWNKPEKVAHQAKLTRSTWRPFPQNRFKWWAFETKRFIGLRVVSACWKPQRVVGAVVQDGKGWLVRLVPSRRLVLQLVSIAFGISLMTLSGYWFVQGRILMGFLSMTLGYAIIVAVWLLSWNHRAAVDDAPIGTPRPLDEIFPHTILILQASPTYEHLVTPVFDSGATTVTHCHYVHSAQSQQRPASAELSRRLRCGDCKTQYNVRGQGELAARLVPCPRCGATLQTAGGGQSSMTTSEAAWAPIISIFCHQCHRLIDVPYASIGASVCCPSCEGDLPVPDTVNRVKLLRQMSHLSRV